MELETALQKITQRENLHLYSNSAYLTEWTEWYRGKVAKFHSYRFYNGVKHIDDRHYSLGMAKRVCEDWANLLINEKTDITLDNEQGQKTLNKIFKDCHFWRKANIGIEETFALGMGGFFVHVDGIGITDDGQADVNKAKVKVSFVNGKKVRPITIEDGEITECAFVSVSSDNKKTYITVHIKGDDGNYKICNVAASGIGDNITYNPDDVTVIETFSPQPWFAILQPNIANNIDINSPLGISIYANAIDILKSIDEIYDSFRNEFKLGRKRVFINVKSSSLNVDFGKNGIENGERRTFDDNDGVFYQLPSPDDESNNFIQDDTQELRVQAHIDGIQQQLNYLSYACGFGTNHYKFDGGSIATATQIVSENSDLFRNIKKHEILIEDVLITIVKAVIYAANNFTNEHIECNPDEITVKFDDSIIEDKESEKASDRSDVTMGIMSKAEFRAKWYAEDEETAKRKIAEIESTTIDDYDLFINSQADDKSGGEELDGQSN